MWCMNGLQKPRQPLQMNTIVVQPLTILDTGRISCLPLGQEPIVFEWFGSTAGFEFDERKSEATNVTAGRYRVRATDANGDRADVNIDVTPMFESAVVISEYRVKPSTTRFSRDGEVSAIGVGMASSMRYLWTTGVETDTPCLQDVPSGTYAVVAIGARNEPAPVTIHKCAPARVEVS